MPQAVVAAVAFVVQYYAVIQTIVAIASVAYSVYSSKAAAQKQEQAQKRASLEAQQRNARRNFRQALTARRTIYGRVRIGGPIIFLANRVTEEAHFVIALAGHEVEEIVNVYILEDSINPLTEPGRKFGYVPGKFSQVLAVWKYLGSPDQNIGTQMRAALFPSDLPAIIPATGRSPALPNPLVSCSLSSLIYESDRFAGIAALYIITKNFSRNFTGQSPEFSALVKGKKLYDPRTGLTAYSANPALALCDYLVNKMDFPLSSIDIPALIRAANICDEIVPLKAGGSEVRYQINGAVIDDNEHRANLDDIAECMAGTFRYASGVWIIEAGSPSEIHPRPIHESDLLESYDVQIGRPDRSVANAVRGNLMDRGTWTPTSFAPYSIASAILAEGAENWMELELPLLTSHTQAQRVVRIALARARAKVSMSIQLDLSGLDYKVGDVVRYSSPELGFTEKLMLVDGFSFAEASASVLSCRLDLIAYDPAAFEWNPDTDEKPLVVRESQFDTIQSVSLGSAQYTETVSSTSPSFGATYVTTWQDPALPTKDIVSVAVEASVTVKTINGSAAFNFRTFTRSYTVLGGVGSVNIVFADSYPAGETYDSHEVDSITLKGTFSDATLTSLVTATES